MYLRVVALPLIAAIYLGSPALAGTASAEQMVKGQGARDRGASGGTRGGGDSGARSGGERRDGGGSRAAERRDGGGERTASSGDRDEGQRRAVPRDRDDRPVIITRGDRNDRPTVIVRDRPTVIVRDRPGLNINIGGPRYYAPAYYDRWARNYYRWSPVGYVPWSLIYGAAGWSNFGFYASIGPRPYYSYSPYGYYGGPGPYSPWQISGHDIGSVRLKIRPRDAQVFVDGYYAGLVDDFDGSFQSLRLDAGGHKIEIHMAGYEDLELDVHVQPGRTLTLQEDLRPRP